MTKLSNKIALITGGTSGIGLASAQLFREEGATVIVTGSSEASVAAARSLGFDAIRSDAGSLSDMDALMLDIGARYGRIDLLFANAGISGPPHSVADATEAAFDLIMSVNLKGMFFLVQKALPLMPDGAAIVLTSSVGAKRAMPGASLYAASKAGGRALCLALAAELMPRRIRVNTLTPGLTDTPMFHKMGPAAKAIVSELAALVPMGRAGSPSELASAALFLASDDSSFMTGTETIVAGGQIDM